MLLLNIVLALIWVSMTGQFTLANFLLGLGLSFILLWVGQRSGPQLSYFNKVQKVINLSFYFIWQLIVANIRVTYDILTPRPYMLPAVVAVPIELKSDTEIMILANLITLTPGTLSLDVSPDQRILYVHTMHLGDVNEFIEEIKSGFERRVRELFE